MQTQAALAAAANHAYEALKLCVAAEGVRASMADPESRAFFDKYSRGEGDESPDPAWRRGFADLIARQFEVYERAKTECVGLGDRVKDGTIYELAARAAEFGNRDAASCYVSMAWPMDRAHWQDQRFRARYRALAPRLIDAGIADGDWRMVGMARIAAGTTKLPDPPAGSTGPEAAVWLSPSIRWLQSTQVDPLRELALVRLKQAGAMDAKWSAIYGKHADQMAQSLPPADARAAADWADRTYRTAFGSKPEMQDSNLTSWYVCQ